MLYSIYILTFLFFFTLPSHSNLYFGKGDGHLGGEYTKVVYRGYTDETFTKNINMDAYLGILGRYPFLNCVFGKERLASYRTKE